MNDAILNELHEITARLDRLIELFTSGLITTETVAGRVETTELEVEGETGPFISIHIGGLGSKEGLAKAVAAELGRLTKISLS